MDDPFPSCRLELVQMPTDQREYEQNLSLQTRSSDAEGILQLNTSQPYNPCPPGENRSTFRSDLTPGSTISYGHPGYTSNAWDATVPEPYELSSGQVSRGLVPENAYLSPPYSTPQFSVSLTTASPDSMDNPLSPSALKHVGKVDLLNWQTESVTFSTPYGTFYQHPAQMETSEGNSLATRANSTSPPISISSQQSPPPSFDSMSPTASATVADSTSPQTSFGDISDQDSADPPYSRLIWEALRSADGNQMPLRVIYKWFEKNTSKGKDKNKGWQNSIRHNLSMNAVSTLL